MVSVRLSNHFFALGRRCGQPGQQQGRRLPAWSSWTARLILRLRVVACLAEMTQQIHSFRASGVRSFQAALVVASAPRASLKSAGVLCTGPGLLTEQNQNLVCPVCGVSLTIRDELALPGALGIFSGKRAFHVFAVF